MTFVVVVLKAVNDSVLTKSTLRHSKYGEFDSSTVFGRSEKGRLKSNSTRMCCEIIIRRNSAVRTIKVALL